MVCVTTDDVFQPQVPHLGSGLVLNVLDSQSLGTRFDAQTEVYLSFLTCVNRVIITIPSPGGLRIPIIVNDGLKRCVNVGVIASAVPFSMYPDSPSGPEAFVTSIVS